MGEINDGTKAKLATFSKVFLEKVIYLSNDINNSGCLGLQPM